MYKIKHWILTIFSRNTFQNYDQWENQKFAILQESFKNIYLMNNKARGFEILYYLLLWL